MEARRLTSSLAVLLLASLSCNIVPADGPAGRGVPTGFEESEPLRFARVSEAKHPGVVAFLAGLPTGLDEDGREALAHAVIQESVRSGLEVELVLGVILVESSGNTRAVSKAGAIGLMQLRPFTAEAVAAEIGLPWTGPTLLFDPVANVRLGVAYLSQLIERYGDVTTALAAYNWGPTHIAARLRRGEPLPAEYVSRVLVAADASALRTQLGS